MIKNSKTYIEEAISSIKQINPRQAKKELKEILFLDVREKEELETSNDLKGDILIPRGLLEFYADPDSPYFDKRLKTEKKIVVFCTLGARGALATKTLNDMGYNNACNLEGGLKKWEEETN